MTPHVVDTQGQRLELYPDGALYWREGRMLLVADLHLGRSETHRSRSLFLPGGTDERDLQRLELVAGITQPEHIMILGDLFHARPALSPEVMHLLDAWLERAGVDVTLIEGNHDVSALRADTKTGRLKRVRGPVEARPFRLTHEPAENDERFGICGHLHPGIRLKDAVGCSLTSKAFWLRRNLLVLPAYGSTTAACALKRTRGDRVFACNGSVLIEC